MDWASYYPAYIAPHAAPEEPHGHDETRMKSLSKHVTVADIGCGFGGLLVALAPKLPDELLLGRLQKYGHHNPFVLTTTRRHGDTNPSHRIRPR